MIVYSLYKYIMIKLLFVNVLQPLDVSLRLYALVMKCGLSIGMVWSRYVTVTTHQKSWEPFPPTGVGLSAVWGGGSMQQRSVSLLTWSPSWNLDF